MRRILMLITIALTFCTANAQQQMADTSFDVSVVRPAFTNHHPKVLFDEAHENFHTASGRYKPFAQLLTNDGCIVTPNKEKFTSVNVLKGYDLLVIANAFNKMDTTAFTREECEVVREWINEGGSLLLITDHMPMSKLSEQLAEALGVSFTLGTVQDSVHRHPGIRENSHLLFTKENGLLAQNAITLHVYSVVSFTGQGVKGPEGSMPILKLPATAYYDMIQLADFKKTDNGINVKIKRSCCVSADGFSQAVAFKLGKGRVIVTGEAAMLTAQVTGVEKAGMNFPGIDNKQLILNMERWLLKR